MLLGAVDKVSELSIDSHHRIDLSYHPIGKLTALNVEDNMIANGYIKTPP